MDFNATAFDVLYPADEGVTVVRRVPAFIGVTDDDVDEAREQTFILLLEIAEAVNSNLISVTRTNSTCVIIDNDGEWSFSESDSEYFFLADIRIGYSQPVYSFNEPRDGDVDNEDVILIREGGRIIYQNSPF
jgi:hypothetical protein